ncbi:MAG TPA: hypothetical protein HPP80_04110, partial [Rhodospirillaceae bacterium]|nr:hypothetical protein [Rhodospirillaceae bacterium]
MTISAIKLKWRAARKDAIAVLARARPPLLSLALLIGLNGLPQAWAQTGPTSLLPPSAPGRAADAVTGSGEKIQIQELGTVDPSSSGLLDAAHGGFPPDLWAGSSLAAIRKSLTLLPGPSPWPSLRLLQTRLLLSTATVPAAQPGEEPLIKLRGDRLWALGDLENLTALLKNVPTPAITPSLRSLKIDTALMTGDAALACEQGTALRLTNADDPFPAKLQVFCQFAAGKTREAGLGVDLLREQKIEDPTFFAAADSLAGIGAGHAPPPPGNPLDLAMVRLAKLPLPDAIPVTLQSPSWLHAMAMATGPATDAKLALAERAEAAGALSSEALRDLYQSVTFSPAELAASLDNLPAQSSPRSHALLFRMSLQQANPNAKALIITKALGNAAEQGSFGS